MSRKIPKKLKNIIPEHDITGDFKSHENRIAKAVNGKKQAGSGNNDYKKGDVDSKSFLIECKTTKYKSMSVKAQWLDKISDEALMEQKHPALAVQMKTKRAEKDWIMIPLSVFQKIKENV